MFNTQFRCVFTSYFITVLLVLCLAAVSLPVQAKKRCKALQQKLYKIQAMQRKGYSLKKGQSLRLREDKARQKWWQCENSSYAKQKTSKRKSAKKKKSTRQKARLANKKQQYARAKKPVKYKAAKVVAAPFINVNHIELRSSYQGEKKYAWLAFYQQPSQCQQPKSLSAFARCSEDKQRQKALFEHSYSVKRRLNN